MSLYNAVCGTNSFAELLLSFLNLTTDDFGRFRDAYIKDGDPLTIVVYTRTGGGNRQFHDYTDEGDEWHGKEGASCGCYSCAINHRLPEHRYYLRDWDDDFDSTFAHIEFSVPDEYKHAVAAIRNGVEGQLTNPRDKFENIVKKMSDPASQDDPDVKKALDFGRKVIDRVNEGKGGAILDSEGDGVIVHVSK